MTPQVSVIIPTWNRAGTIGAAVQSAARQDLVSLEILVCDDGSRDDTKEIVAAMKDERVVWCPGDHGGRAAIPRNRGLERSRGEWIAFLDSDDEWLPEKLDRQIALATRLGCRAAASHALRRVPGRQSRSNVVTWTKETLSFSDLLVTNRIVSSTVVIHRSLLDSVGRFPEQPQIVVGEDYAFWLRVATLTDFAFVREPLAIYRDEAAKSIRKSGPGPFAVRKQVLADFLEWCGRQGVDGRYREEAKKRLAPLGLMRSTVARRWHELRDRVRERP